MEAAFPIVGVGASAGGVEALGAFFGAMPGENGMAFIVVTHLDPARGSVLAEILARRTPMPVQTAQDEELVEPQRVYVMPPDAILTIEDGRIRLRKPDPVHRERTPIDIFFSSLAEERKELAVGIVLSGGGSDGTLGIKAIKEHGGLSVAQGVDDGQPRFKDMPASAVASGLVDLIVPVEEIPQRLLAYFEAGRRAASTAAENDASDREDDADALAQICSILRTRLGHDFSEYKDKTFIRRIERRMRVHQLASLGDYAGLLRKAPEEASLLFRDLLISVTNFFRDAAAFHKLGGEILPQLLASKKDGDEVRIWVPGCATGEEVYSIGILLREHMEKLGHMPRLQIFATDIDESAMSIARAGRYTPPLLRDVSPERLERYFVREGAYYRVVKEVRDMCIFSTHSVIRDPPFSRLDLISCRNLLIYLNAGLQARLIPVFHYALRPRGFLFLGMSETISRHSDLFAPVDKKSRVFQRRDLVAPMANALARLTPTSLTLSLPSGSTRHLAGPKPDILQAAAATVAERFVPAYVLVNDDGTILHFSARTGRYLEPAVGAPSRDIMTMVRKSLRPDLRAALGRAVATRQSVTIDRAAVEIDNGIQPVSLTVEPITRGAETVFLIVFADAGLAKPPTETPRDMPLTAESGIIRQLETELQESRERLQATIEELETSNEELKSSNEEMLSINEEMQSTNEELETSKEETQSINEELQTVNSELQNKVEELDRANADLRNLFESTEVATIFLDRNLVIRSFTPAAGRVFSLIDSDRGRPLTDIASRLDNEDLRREVTVVGTTRQPIERRVSADHGADHYFMRVLPYRGGEEILGGVLLTFFNVTSIIEAEERQKKLTDELNHRVKNTLQVVMSIATQTLQGVSGTEALAIFSERLHALALTHDLLSRGAWRDVSLEELLRTALAAFAGKDGERATLNGTPVSLKPRAAVTVGMVIHELATNALKHGSLSQPGGRVELSWALHRDQTPARLELQWRENQGPRAAAPNTNGFGVNFIERSIAYELRGRSRFDFDSGALHFTLEIPADPSLVIEAP